MEAQISGLKNKPLIAGHVPARGPTNGDMKQYLRCIPAQQYTFNISYTPSHVEGFAGRGLGGLQCGMTCAMI